MKIQAQIKTAANILRHVDLKWSEIVAWVLLGSVLGLVISAFTKEVVACWVIAV